MVLLIYLNERNLTMKKGFTLIELLIVVIILGILAAVAIPGYSKSIKKNQANQAVTYLRATRLAEKMYYTKNSPATYLACANATAIRSNLGVEVTTENYSFDVTATAPTTGFLARARSGTTAPANCTDADTICIDQDGTWTGSSAYKPTI